MEEILATSIQYGKLEVVDPKNHGKLRIDESLGYSYARSATILPINIIEFSTVVRHYPILFGSDDDKMPVILTGLEDGGNLFVKDDGSWNEGCYIPACVRRYPFLLKEMDEGVRLCLDADSMNLNSMIGEPLFDKGKPTEILSARAKFAATYAREQSRTYSFVQECVRQDLLVDKNVDVTLKDDRQVSIRGFLAIDSQRFQDMPGPVVQEWWQKGYLGLAFAHFNSMGNFGRLFHKTNIHLSGG